MGARVVLVEDHVTYRQCFRIALEAQSTFKVVGEAGRARDALRLIDELRPDMAVIDFLLPDGNGLTLIHELKRKHRNLKTVLLGRLQHPALTNGARKGGSRAVVHKDQPLSEVIEIMIQAFEKPSTDVPLSEEAGDAENSLNRLTAREREIMFLVTQGLSSKEISQALFLAPKTIDAHRCHINKKLGVRSAGELTRLVAQQGLLG
jgi:DNA-binding NarL/FixJ family response regulator